MSQSTYLDLITRSFQLSGVTGSGESPDSSQVQDGIWALHNLTDTLNADNLNVFTIAILSIPVVALQQQYLVGPSDPTATPPIVSDFNITVRPPALNGVWFQQTTGAYPTDIPVTLMSEEDWGNMRAKNVPGTIGTFGYYDQNFPRATLYIWPVPSGGGNLILHAQKMLNDAALLTDLLVYPPGYKQAIYYDLAIKLAILNGVEPLPTVKEIAESSMLSLQNNNGQIIQQLDYDDACMGSNQARYLISSDSRRN